MSFSRVNPGGWALNDPFTPAQMNQLDIDHSRAVDGLNGGTYANASTIQFDGRFTTTSITELQGTNSFGSGPGDTQAFAGAAQFLSTAQFDDDATFNGDVTLAGTTTFTGYTDFVGSVQFDDPVTFGDDVSFGDPVTFTDTTTFNGTASFTGAVGFSGIVGFEAEVDIGNSSADVLLVVATSTFSSPVTLADPVTFSGDGHLRYRLTTGANADTTYNVSQYDEIIVLNTGISADRVYTLGSTGAADGSRMRIHNKDSSFKITVKRGTDLSTITELKNTAAGFMTWIDVVWQSGRWELSAFYYHQ